MNFNDAEYQRSNGAVSAGAITAWNAGATGRGIKVGVIDTGLNSSLAEFAGRIDPASRDLVANRGVADSEGHGTAVSGVIAAARNGTQNVGLAFESTIISLNSSNPNDCDDEDGCKHNDNDIAQGIDIAVANGARVINISLGGDGIGSTMLSAVRRASAAGVVMVISAGNDSAADPSAFAVGAARQSNGLVIIAGAHDSARALADFSNKAGSGSGYYLTALGVRVRTIDENGTGTLWSGTSFSAPVVTGAAALLAQAFPNLTGHQIVELLLTTADDAGAAGTDAEFGRGILNLQRAFQPQGAITMAGSAAPVPAIAGSGSGAMGDASSAGTMKGAIVLDGYSRAFVADLTTRLLQAPQERPLARGLVGDQRSATVQNRMVAVSLTLDRRQGTQPQVGLAQLGLTYEDGRRARVLSGMMVSRISPNTALALGFSESGRALQQRLSGQYGTAFLVARDPSGKMGFYGSNSASIGLRHDLGAVGLTVTGERGDVYQDGVQRARRAALPGYTVGAVTFDRRIGSARLSLGATRLDERETILGGRLASSFSNGGATSWFADAAADVSLGDGWSAYASYRRGTTTLSSGLLATGGRLTSDAWAMDLARRNAFRTGDMLAIRLMQPLRVRSGGYDINLPVSYDYADGSVGYERRVFNLAPTGREIDFEAAYGVGMWSGYVSANAFARRQPGHISGAESDLGGAIRFTLGF
ncbi:S8 family peptidase [Sphingosinicella sp. BN140058]|uniref:S8 family peptidase n=1 Tax=Sphingosinicella sp. BN140058 TaxID=1892855 RepID=UPI0013E99EC2|nr:S8 family peptidase [Sphingosinicella sp. BN140058]